MIAIPFSPTYAATSNVITITVDFTSAATFYSNDHYYWPPEQAERDELLAAFTRDIERARKRLPLWPEPELPEPPTRRPALPKVLPPKILRVQARGG